MTGRSLQHSIYKGVNGKFGAAQFNFQKPHFYQGKDKDFVGDRALDENGKLREGWKNREGAIFGEFASPNGPNEYDWAKKITMAFDVNDLGKLALSLSTGKDCRLLHDPGAKSERQGVVTKVLAISSPGGVTEKGVMLTVTEKSGGESRTHTVPLSPDECLVLSTLLRSAIPLALNWSV